MILIKRKKIPGVKKGKYFVRVRVDGLSVHEELLSSYKVIVIKTMYY
jgi:hypothetical protein